MSLAAGLRKARLAAGIVRYLREPVGPEEALAEVWARTDQREARFLRLAGTSIFGDPRSPYVALLRWAGWDFTRLKRQVEDDGLETTLAALRDHDVRISLEEFKGRTPIRRGELVLEPAISGFDNVRMRQRGVRAATSGTSSASPTTVLYDWNLFGEEAALECLLFESHGLLDAPCALWLPGLPSVSGIHNLVVHMGFRRPPERWFSQLPLRRRDAPTLRFLRHVGARFSLRVPLPETVTPTDTARVADWLGSTRDRRGAAVLKTFATSAVRVAEAALRQRIDLGGCVIFTGGEPLTERRRTFIAATGARVFARYVATETGWIGGACPHSGSPDAMHLYSDRLAVVAGEPAAEVSPLLFTTLSPSSGTVLLNADLGDAARLRRRRCPCPLGRAGLDVEVSGVHGHDKVTGEGITVSTTTLSEILDDLVGAAGGPPDSYQLREEEDDRGASRLVIVLAPEVQIRDAELVRSLLERLPSHGNAAKLAARLWHESGTIEVRRAYPELSSGAKLTSFVRRTTESA